MVDVWLKGKGGEDLLYNNICHDLQFKNHRIIFEFINEGILLLLIIFFAGLGRTVLVLTGPLIATAFLAAMAFLLFKIANGFARSTVLLIAIAFLETGLVVVLIDVEGVVSTG